VLAARLGCRVAYRAPAAGCLVNGAACLWGHSSRFKTAVGKIMRAQRAVVSGQATFSAAAARSRGPGPLIAVLAGRAAFPTLSRPISNPRTFLARLCARTQP